MTCGVMMLFRDRVHMAKMLILDLCFLWQLTPAFKEQRNLLFPFNQATNIICFHVERLELEASTYLMN